MKDIHSQPSISRPTDGLLAPTETEHSTETRVNILSFAARVAGNCPAVLRDLALLYPKPEMDSSHISSPTAAPFAVVERDPDGSEPCYRLYEDGTEVCVVASSESAVAHLEMLVNAAAVASFGDYLLIHAGMVAIPSGGVMIPAASGAGKSTLVAALALSGFDYLSDEVAVLEPGSLTALPFLKAICLKDGGWERLTASFDAPAPLVHAVRAGGEALHYMAAPTHLAAESRTRVRYIVLPFRQAGARATLTPFSRAVTLAELARNSLNLPRHGASGFETLARLVEQAECYALTYEDLRDAVAVISDLVGLAPAPSPLSPECDVPKLIGDRGLGPGLARG